MKQLNTAFKQWAHTQAERGQAIVLIALFMVVMLAMVGVALDGGGLFWLWRNAQNAADVAALQAAYDRCTGATEPEWVVSGETAARINGFDNDGIDNWVIVDDFDGTNMDTDFTRVQIRAQKPKYFIQLVYRGELEVVAQAIVYCTGAIDFSDLPGMVALGGCECNGNANDRMAFSGSAFRVDGDVHSNCNVKIQPGNSEQNHGDSEGISAVGTITDLDKVEETEPAEPGAEPKELPALIPIDLYFPDGEIFEAINDAHPGYAQHFDSSVSLSGGSAPAGMRVPLEGLIAVDGDFTVNHTFNPSGPDFGPEGLTVVATGRIRYEGLTRDGGLIQGNWWYYGHNVNNPGGHEGVTVRWSRGDGSAIAMYALFDSRPACNGSPLDGIEILPVGGGQGDDDIDVNGIVMAPYSLITWNGPTVRAKGPIIGWGLDFSGSDFHWIPEPSFLQPMAPTMNNVE